ncbi:ribonuclease III [Clostridium formicaceticum]|uniref:Ribonuclease 3 n=1 Tax=Clostridium formicaceticum TaxID=1497 RepID=A0AAC9RIV4_9CLOT|nr:ribonuclease III [Clostridium formicaceticum]AOY77345.1 ribonuclease III [Clostridium formicaceticum]ARE87889.1 Ribonuclease 3 [Clostridium formicaceticum]
MPHINSHTEEYISRLQETLNYRFRNIDILKEALTHSSYANESKNKKVRYNERLEFLGDSVLSLVISEYVFLKYKHLPEGELTKVRANVVCEASLAAQGRVIDIGQYLFLGRGEEFTGGRQRESILADAFEAVIGAIYLDGGIEKAKAFILSHFLESIDLATKGILFRDYKTHLQELLQSKTSQKITYNVVREYGPDHNKSFDVEVLIGEKVIGRGSGKSKKEAEQRAAEEAIKRG